VIHREHVFCASFCQLNDDVDDDMMAKQVTIIWHTFRSDSVATGVTAFSTTPTLTATSSTLSAGSQCAVLHKQIQLQPLAVWRRHHRLRNLIIHRSVHAHHSSSIVADHTADWRVVTRPERRPNRLKYHQNVRRLHADLHRNPSHSFTCHKGQHSVTHKCENGPPKIFKKTLKKR